MTLGYYDPDSLKIGDAEGQITFHSAADANDTHVVMIRTKSDAKRVIAALKDQKKNGLAGLNGRFRKVQGAFSKIPGSISEGIVTDTSSRKQTPVRMTFDAKPGDLPIRGLCIAMGEYVDGALLVDRMTISPIAPVPMPGQAMGAMNG